MNINLNDNLTDEEIDQLVKTRNELTLKIDSHFKKKKKTGFWLLSAA